MTKQYNEQCNTIQPNGNRLDSHRSRYALNDVSDPMAYQAPVALTGIHCSLLKGYM